MAIERIRLCVSAYGSVSSVDCSVWLGRCRRRYLVDRYCRVVRIRKGVSPLARYSFKFKF